MRIVSSYQAFLLVQDVYKRQGYTLSDDEIGFILIHFQAALERHNLSKKIAIVYNCNLANALLIENQIKINLPTFDVIELINIQDLKEKYLHDFDFIISTMEVSTDLPSVVISPLADSNDIQKIKQTYDKLCLLYTSSFLITWLLGARITYFLNVHTMNKFPLTNPLDKRNRIFDEPLQ